MSVSQVGRQRRHLKAEERARTQHALSRGRAQGRHQTILCRVVQEFWPGDEGEGADRENTNVLRVKVEPVEEGLAGYKGRLGKLSLPVKEHPSWVSMHFGPGGLVEKLVEVELIFPNIATGVVITSSARHGNVFIRGEGETSSEETNQGMAFDLGFVLLG